jgi:hypothetical protein
MYSLDFAAQVSRICMDEIRRRGNKNYKQKCIVHQLLKTNCMNFIIIGLKERKILRKSGTYNIISLFSLPITEIFCYCIHHMVPFFPPPRISLLVISSSTVYRS